ncbi:MAG: type II toxin-antitoxin system RelE/ParE family toxin [Crocinitomicaceae bacterium]|nr:type II toxin-antitoxin system RelE/ParE family toxin [Crocinitomicaceae bacterium]
MGYRISKLAIKDLEEIWLYTRSKWSTEQADEYHSQIILKIEFIANNFLMGRPIEETRRNYRVMQVKSHLIFYRKVDGDLVEIVRILHHRMDIKRRIK